jgi:ribosomal subunit interface protein
MQVKVSGKHIAVGDALRSRITDELNAVVDKYFGRGGINAEVVVGKQGHSFQLECVLRLASGQQLDTSGSGPDAYAAFDAALGKIGVRVRRYTRRLKSHRQRAVREAAAPAPDVAPPARRAPGKDHVWDQLTESGLISRGPAGGVVIAEAPAPPRTMTVSMAALELDLTESQTIVFRSAAHGGLSVVYRRPDGNIGWIDPERTRRAAGVCV